MRQRRPGSCWASQAAAARLNWGQPGPRAGSDPAPQRHRTASVGFGECPRALEDGRVGSPARMQLQSSWRNPTRTRGGLSVGPAQVGQYRPEPRQFVRSGRRPTAGGAVHGWAETIRGRRGKLKIAIFRPWYSGGTQSTEEFASSRFSRSFCFTRPPALVVPSPRRSPPRSPGSLFTRHLALDMVGAAPGAPGRYPGGAAAAVTTAVTAVLRPCPDGTVRTLTRPVRAWFVTPGP